MKFSIVTPSFNQGRFILRTLQSVARQTGVALEHVVFDGGSTDETVAVLREFGNGIRWVSEPDGGQAQAVNRGIVASDGEIIGWLNSDDIYYDGALATVAAFFCDYPDVDVVYGGADHIDIHDQSFEEYPTEDWDFPRLMERCFICQPALFFRREIIAKHGLLDEKLNYCMDYEFWLRLAKSGVRFARVPQKLAGSRMYADNKTLGARVRVHREINDMLKAKFGVVPERWIYNYAHAIVENRMGGAGSRTRRFRRAVAIRTVAAAIRWNRGPSMDMWRRIIRWWRGPRPTHQA